jgi:hypothetical protein
MKIKLKAVLQAASARDCRTALAKFAMLIAVLLCCVSAASAQVYGVSRHTAVAAGPNGAVAARQTTVVGPNGAATKTTVVGASGAASRTTVVAPVYPAHSTTVVVSNGGLPRGYIAVVPAGYRMVTISGVRYYTVGGIYYRPQMYQGRTVYVTVRL